MPFATLRLIPHAVWLVLTGGNLRHAATRGQYGEELLAAIGDWLDERTTAGAITVSDAARRLQLHLGQLGPLSGMSGFGLHAAETATFLRSLEDLDQAARQYASGLEAQEPASMAALRAAILSYVGTSQRLDALQRRN